MVVVKRSPYVASYNIPAVLSGSVGCCGAVGRFHRCVSLRRRRSLHADRLPRRSRAGDWRSWLVFQHAVGAHFRGLSAGVGSALVRRHAAVYLVSRAWRWSRVVALRGGGPPLGIRLHVVRFGGHTPPNLMSRKVNRCDPLNHCVQAMPDCALLFIVAQVSGAPDADC